jgi:hypothetical protein
MLIVCAVMLKRRSIGSVTIVGTDEQGGIVANWTYDGLVVDVVIHCAIRRSAPNNWIKSIIHTHRITTLSWKG